MKKLRKLQTKRFDSMSKAELMYTISDLNKQLSMIQFSGTRGGQQKRDELEARVAYLENRLRGLR